MKKRSDGSVEVGKLKERHIVVWTQEEDDILREQIRTYGTENWAIIASKFNDKTNRQCRRRWYTYLNSDFKKGGWTPEEDMLLCEVQRKYGNKWTEIAKMVSGRTDNAVKNRFSTLCKKQVKREALAKENNTSLTSAGKKRILLQNELEASETQELAAPYKKMRRTHFPVAAESCNHEGVGPGENGTKEQSQLRPPLAAVAQNSADAANMIDRRHNPIERELSYNAQINGHGGKSQTKDDLKVQAFVQQAELLTSPAVQVNTPDSEQSLENTLKVLHHFLSQIKDGNMLECHILDVNSQLGEFKNLLKDLKNRKEGMRQPDLYEESSGSSEYSTGSTLVSNLTAGTPCNHPIDIHQIGSHNHDQKEKDESLMMFCSLSYQDVQDHVLLSVEADGFQSSQEPNSDEAVSSESTAEFGSPLHVTPLFPAESAEVPSPQFSESERNFLMKALGMEPPRPHPSTNQSQPQPICKRVLLHSL